FIELIKTWLFRRALFPAPGAGKNPTLEFGGWGFSSCFVLYSQQYYCHLLSGRWYRNSVGASECNVGLRQRSAGQRCAPRLIGKRNAGSRQDGSVECKDRIQRSLSGYPKDVGRLGAIFQDNRAARIYSQAARNLEDVDAIATQIDRPRYGNHAGVCIHARGYGL